MTDYRTQRNEEMLTHVEEPVVSPLTVADLKQ